MDYEPKQTIRELIRAAAYSFAAARIALEGGAEPEEVLADISVELEAALQGVGMELRDALWSMAVPGRADN